MEEFDITPEQQKAYLEAPNTCPFCGSTDVRGAHIDSDCGTGATRNIKCRSCKMEWTEIFEMVSIENAFKDE